MAMLFYIHCEIRRRADLMLVLANVGLPTFTRTNALESRDFGHRGKPAGESVVKWAWNPFDDDWQPP
jgi:hypothetical protein